MADLRTLTKNNPYACAAGLFGIATTLAVKAGDPMLIVVVAFSYLLILIALFAPEDR